MVQKWIESSRFPAKLWLPNDPSQQYIKSYHPNYNLQDFEYIEIRGESVDQQSQLFYKFILQDESIKEKKIPTQEFKMLLKPHKHQTKQLRTCQIFDSLLVDFIRQPIRTQDKIKQGLKIAIDLEYSQKSSKIKICFSHVPDQDGICIENYCATAPAFVIDVVIAATRIKKNIEVFDMIIGPGEMRHRSLYPEH